MRIDFKYRTLTIVWFRNIWLGGRPGAKFKIGIRPIIRRTRFDVSFFIGYYVLIISIYKQWAARHKGKLRRIKER